MTPYLLNLIKDKNGEPDLSLINDSNEELKLSFFKVDLQHNYDVFEAVEDKFKYAWEVESLEGRVICIQFTFEDPGVFGLHGEDSFEFEFAFEQKKEISGR